MKILICDDEKAICTSLKRKIRNINENAEIISFGNSFQLYEYIDKNCRDIDAIFMDLEFENDKLNGVNYSQEIMRIYPEIKIIFVSGHTEEYVEEIFLSTPKVNVFGFLRKPVDEKKLKVYLDKLEKVHKQNRIIHSLEFKVINNGIIYINYEDIIYIESDKRHVIVYTKNGEYEGFYRIGEIMGRLSKNTNRFYWCNKRDIVNISEIRHILGKENSVELANQKIIPLSNYNNTTIAQKRREISMLISSQGAF